jgi:acetyl-CoA carboxylase carboxyl transferase subunit beta
MGWLNKLLPPKIKRNDTGVARKSSLPEGLWSKCPACEAVLYATDLANNCNVCPKCGHHKRLESRARIDLLLDARDVPRLLRRCCRSIRFRSRTAAAIRSACRMPPRATGETDALVVVRGSIRTLPVVLAVFEFDFMGGSMGSVLGERFVRGVQAASRAGLPFICVTASGGARMQEGLFSLMQMAKTTAILTRLSQAKLPVHLDSY